MSLFQRISVDELVALNDEIAALARAGVPLDKGLKAIARDLPGRLRNTVEDVAHQLSAGQSLSDALGGVGVPDIYRAIVEAGIRSGRLASALEGIANAARRAADVRRITTAAALYPVAVLAVASGAFLVTAMWTLPVMRSAFAEFGLTRSPFFTALLAAADWLAAALPWLWVGLLLAMATVHFMTRRAAAVYTGGLSWIPSGAALARERCLAVFCDLLALLIEQQVPLNEALLLAAESSGNRGLRQAAQHFADQLRDGRSYAADSSALPPLTVWLMQTSSKPELLVKTLRRTAESHRRRAARLETWLSVYFPILASAAIGGTAALLYVLLVAGPFYEFLTGLGLK